MNTHLLRTTVTLPRGIEEVFAFFADARNLERLTPPGLSFEILTPLPATMAAGTLLDYRLRLGGIPFRWRTRIASWNPPHEFVDEQLRGPYREWIHTHRFRETAQGAAVEDEVRYRLPLWPLGELAYPLVRRELARIFRFREAALREALG